VAGNEDWERTKKPKGGRSRQKAQNQRNNYFVLNLKPNSEK